MQPKSERVRDLAVERGVKILDVRLKWYGIEPIEEKEAKDLVGDDEIYEEECDCDFNQDAEFNCSCGWNENITLDEHKAFQDMRVVSQLGVHERLD